MTLAEQIAAIEDISTDSTYDANYRDGIYETLKVIRLQATMIEKARDALQWYADKGRVPSRAIEALKALSPDQEVL